jgi:mannosyltransferase
MADLRSDQAVGTAPPRPGGNVPGGRPAARRSAGWVVVALPALVELVVGGYRISVPSFWRDEAYTITGAKRSVSMIFTLVRHEDAFHGLYLLLMHAVIANFGTSEAALRVPSLIAMSAAVGMTAALGRKLARASGMSGASAVGIIAGLLLVALPVTTRYAQEGRPYALAEFFAVLTTYLLVVASARTGWRCWALYSAALLVTSLFDLAAVLLAGAHGVSLLAARRAESTDDAQDPAAGAGLSAKVLRRWVVASLAAAIVLSPVAVFSFRQSAQLDWVQRPDLSTVMALLLDFAGVSWLIPVIGVLAVVGCIAARGLRRGRGLTLALICLPWFLLPPSLLLLVSIADPVYVDRYILFSVPALVLLVSAGLVRIASFIGQRTAGWSSARRARMLSVAPSAALAALIGVMLIGPQAAIRLPNSRADDIRTIARVLANHEQPGDAILYLPRKTAVIGMAYPDPFKQLRDIDLLTGPIRSGTLLGDPAGPKVVAARLRGVRRVWTVEWVHPLAPDSVPPPDLVRLLAGMRVVDSWLIQSIWLVLYAAPSK